LFIGFNQGIEIAEMPRQVARGAFADVADAERVDQALERRIARALQLGNQVGRRLLAHPFQVRELL